MIKARGAEATNDIENPDKIPKPTKDEGRLVGKPGGPESPSDPSSA
jgi:hypothetical protein